MTIKTYIANSARLRLFALACLFVAVGCGSLDNFDVDDFSFFDDSGKNPATELRQYTLPGESQSPVIFYIRDNGDKNSVANDRNIRKVCDYTKLPYKSIDIESFNVKPALPASTRSLCVYNIKRLNQAALNKLTEFVAAGGTLLLPLASEDRRMQFFAGLRPDCDFETDITSKGFFFSTAILPNLKGKTYDENVQHYGYARSNFRKDVKILATAANNKEFPSIVENPIGKGKVIFYNTTIEYEKIHRGLLFAGLLRGLDGIPYPIANTSTIFLDDFPSPVYDIKSEPIKSELDLTITDFVKDVWWPDMKKIAEKYKISYSAMIAFDYKNNVEPPFLFDQWDSHKIKVNKKTEILSDWLVFDSKKHGHELCLHGYNHVEFKKGHWKNPEFIGMALKSVQKKWGIANYGPLPVTYVPPSNIIDPAGVDYLRKGMPSIKYICSLYLGEPTEGGAREFDFDPYNKDFFDYPRISDGFYMETDKKFSLESMYLYTGIWTHFVHPDDVYQIPSPFNKSSGDFDLRNARELGWRKTKGKGIGMLGEFTAILDEMARTYPQLRYVNAGEGGKIVNDWRASKFVHENRGGLYSVRELEPEKSMGNTQYWFLYAGFQNAPKIDASLQKEEALYSKTPFMEGFLYSVYTHKSELNLTDVNQKSAAQRKETDRIVKSVAQQYKAFIAKQKKHMSGVADVVEEEDPDLVMDREMFRFSQKLMAKPTIDSTEWNRYAKYMAWDKERPIDVWKMLEEYCVKYPTKDNIMYSKELDRLIGYPNDLTMEKWLNAQLLVTPNDVQLLNSYVANFYTPENQEKIKKALQALLKVETNFETYLQYLQHLMTYEPKTAREELDKIKPEGKYGPIATDVAWLYADNNEFEKAYAWALLSDDIDFASKMSWMLEIKAYKPLEDEYKKYIAINPDDYKTKAVMAGIYHEQGRFLEAWILAKSLPDSPEKDELRAMLNKDVMYVEEALQQELVLKHPELFYPEVLAALTKDFRKQYGDFVSINSAMETNKDLPQFFKNVATYGHFDKKKNMHSFSFTYSRMYDIKIDLYDPKDNLTNSVYGLQYQFNNPVDAEKLQYWGRGRVEYTDYGNIYFHAGLGASKSFGKSFFSAEAKLFPAETGPAYRKEIYRTQAVAYGEFFFLKHFNQNMTVEGNYYSASKSRTPIQIGASYEVILTSKTVWDNGADVRMRFLPFVEASFSQGSVGKSVNANTAYGYPYWVLDERLYYGGGIGWRYGKQDSDLTAKLEASYFQDDYSGNFMRYTGEANWQIWDYTSLSATFEMYTQDKFYSNAFLLGVKHNLKKRAKK
ncbi:DUF2194 domain-containing protein [Flavobacterium sp. MAH-1]|uniref:DUF2194 domain-containing protein n=1 Tax=Flavobacterium agri TaxID=2743471 RepID=A0A7Y8XZX3_9FLAO|nr:DUF2194 domain-containing protein [Flavobacterium agri]NUY79913.1 DUF2194 domain-containing protein [Flavobacterium agri]NYA69938.1 DUF2194 domain-containing protein [Flavobacterium agri]